VEHSDYRALVATIAALRGLELSERSLALAAEGMKRMVETGGLRVLGFPYPGSAIEPQTAQRWIEDGGRSR
jgi:hypothetical protein